jgi:hypothetical protein
MVFFQRGHLAHSEKKQWIQQQTLPREFAGICAEAKNLCRKLSKEKEH